MNELHPLSHTKDEQILLATTVTLNHPRTRLVKVIVIQILDFL